MMPKITLKVTGGATTFAIDPNDLVSVKLPFEPAVVNPQHVRHLSAKDWRHQDTGWYEEEHKFLARLSQENPDFQCAIDEMRLLLYAVFVKEAEVRRPGKLLTSSHKRFTKEYAKFCEKWRSRPRLLSN